MTSALIEIEQEPNAEAVRKKAILISGGGVRLPEGFDLPVRVSHSTAGPGAGSDAAVFAFEGLRVKKPISYTQGDFELRVEGESMSLTHKGEPFINDVRIIPVARHCPGQAFFDLDPRCIYHCVFCGSPLLQEKDFKNLDTKRIMEMLEETLAVQDLTAVSFTSGVVGSMEETVQRLAEAISETRSRLPGIPIGVEPYVTSTEQIEALRAAGADEIKLNIQAARDDIFAKVCPDLNRQNIWRMLEASVEIFGRGRVLSNVLVGLGEEDEDVRSILERLTSMGVIPSLRAIRITKLNRQRLIDVLGEMEPVKPERLIRLAAMHRKVMVDNGFSAMISKTMCCECGCCDLVPFKDI